MVPPDAERIIRHVAEAERAYWLLINQAAEIDHYQPLLFVVEGFDQLFEMVDRLERWMREGKLDNVAPGPPEVAKADLASFMNAG